MYQDFARLSVFAARTGLLSRCLMVGSSLLGLCVASEAMAQNANDDAQSSDTMEMTGLDTPGEPKTRTTENMIVVTARKRAESTQEIPESISVLTAQTLEQNEINTPTTWVCG